VSGRAGGVLAAVITHNPDAGFPDRLAALAAQVEVVVVDNGSDNRSSVEAAAHATRSDLICNGRNLGTAAALNQAAQLAMRLGFTWLAAFDQDSTLASGAVQSILDTYEAHPDRERIAVIATSRINARSGRPYGGPANTLLESTDWRAVRTTMTSGSFVLLKAYNTIGPFDISLFIDSVDHEFCLRCRRNGFIIVEVKTIMMRHALGYSEVHSLFWRRYSAKNYSPDRHYYMTRNLFELFYRYSTFDPKFCAYILDYRVKLILKALLFERDRLQKLIAIVQGIGDFFARKSGPRVPDARERRRNRLTD
jgi:rhamnosyltransferase